MKKILAGTAIFIAVGLISSYINHKIKLSKEENLFVPKGQIIDVGGHKAHIYTEGSGEKTLVFMSGGGTCSPMLDFKSLYSSLSDKYKIAVVERTGYGFSDDTEVDRDIDSVLRETRDVLLKSGIEGPYILMPHSMAGLEAIYWAQNYPEEVEAIIGLDMAVPEAYSDYSINSTVLRLGSIASELGVTRFFPSLADSSSAVRHGTLTEEEKSTYRAVFYRRTLTDAMLKEMKSVEENAKSVEENSFPKIPILLFVSNGDGTGWSREKWLNIQESYAEQSGAERVIELDCGHYVHNEEYEKVSEESVAFIERMARGK